MIVVNFFRSEWVLAKGINRDVRPKTKTTLCANLRLFYAEAHNKKSNSRSKLKLKYVKKYGEENVNINLLLSVRTCFVWERTQFAVQQLFSDSYTMSGFISPCIFRMTWKGRAEKLNEVQFLIPPKMKTIMAPGESREGNQSLTSKMLGFTETAFRSSCGDAALCEICSIFSL